MAHIEAYQEYQRIEDFEEDSPPGEENLLLHVPEGLKGKQLNYTWSCKSAVVNWHIHKWNDVMILSWGWFSHPYVTDSWHHIKNLDNFFARISFVTV